MLSNAAPFPLPDVVVRWRNALDNLSPATSPCRYLTPVPTRRGHLDQARRIPKADIHRQSKNIGLEPNGTSLNHNQFLPTGSQRSDARFTSALLLWHQRV